MGQPTVTDVTGTAAFSTPGTDTGTQDQSSVAGLTVNVTGSKTFTINPDGTGTGPSAALSFEVINGTDLYFVTPNTAIESVRTFTQ